MRENREQTVWAEICQAVRGREKGGPRTRYGDEVHHAVAVQEEGERCERVALPVLVHRVDREAEKQSFKHHTRVEQNMVNPTSLRTSEPAYLGSHIAQI